MPGLSRRRLLISAGVVALTACACGGSQAGRTQRTVPGWTFATSMPVRRSYFAAAEIQNQIYVAGGMFGPAGTQLATFDRFDPRRDRWSSMPSLPDPVRAGMGAAMGRVFYVAGGLNAATRATRRVFAYDLARRRWTTRAPLPVARYNGALVALDGRLYEIGGYAGDRARSGVYSYDPMSNAWRRRASLPVPMHALAAVAFHGRLWTIGGRRGQHPTRAVWVYDPHSNRWHRGPFMPEAMELDGAAVVGNTIQAVWQRRYQIYHAATGRWTEGPPPLIPRHALGLFYADGSLYSIGGCTLELHDSQVVERRQLPPA